MKLVNTQSRYGAISRALHWIIVLGIIAQWLLAEAGEGQEETVRDGLDSLSLHESLGLTILALAVFRLLWRLVNPVPAWPADLKPYEIAMARVVHLAFYVLLLAIPLSGWALASVEGGPLRFFSWFDVPRMSVGTEDTLEEVHEVLFNVLVALALLHAAGAVKHFLTRRNAARAHTTSH